MHDLACVRVPTLVCAGGVVLPDCEVLWCTMCCLLCW